MRIHFQNAAAGGPLRPMTGAEWDAVPGSAAAGHAVSFGSTPEEFRAAMAEAEALVIATSALRPLLPLDAPRLRTVFCMSAGLDSLAPFDWLPPGVALLNNSGAHAVKGAEYVLMAMLMLANRIPGFIADQHGKRWSRRHGTTLAGQRCTVLGLGAIGGAVARLATACGMAVTGVRTAAEPHPHCQSVITLDGLDDVLTRTDYLAITMPLTPATRQLMDRRRISLLPHTAGLINLGRGGLLDQDALCDALAAGTIGGAVLDVFVPEPVPPESRLWETPNLVMTPHMSSDDPDRYNSLSFGIFLENMRAEERGQPMPNLFDIGRGY